jgi:pSer/pThr/pTyr-binding forkhead associated (FHA) protein
LNIGEIFIVVNIVSKNDNLGKISIIPNNYNEFQIRLKLFGKTNNGDILYIMNIIFSYFDSNKEKITIGRGNNNDINLYDKMLSKVHCVIQFSKEKDTWIIQDGEELNKSTNGTW